MKDSDRCSSTKGEGAEALNLMERALVLVDVYDPAGIVGPHLDLAICHLSHILDRKQSETEGVTRKADLIGA